MIKKQNSNLMESAVLLTCVSAFSLLFSFVQQAVFAKYFGTMADSDAYTIATQIPVVLFSVISTAISTVVIPLYSKSLYQEGKEAAAKFSSNFITIICCFTAVVVLICEIIAGPIVYVFAPGLGASTHDLTVALVRLTFPTMILSEAIAVNEGILNVHKSFVLPALTSNLLNTCFVVIVILFAQSYGIMAAAAGMIIGTVAEFIYSIIITKKYVRYHWDFNLHDRRIVDATKMSGPIFVGIGADELNKMIDKMVSSFLTTGSISALNYGSKLTSAISSLLLSSISTVVYPQLVKAASKENKSSLAEYYIHTLSAYVIIIIPIIFGGILLQKEIVSVVFKRGVFDENSVEQTAPLFGCYLVCLLFTAFRQASSRVFYSFGDSKTPMKNSIIGIGINIVLNIILARFLGAFGLALATAISAFIISMLLLRDTKERVKEITYNGWYVTITKSFISAAIMTVILCFLKQFIWSIYNGTSFGTIQMAVAIVVLVLVGIFIYFAFLLLLGTDELKYFVRSLRK